MILFSVIFLEPILKQAGAIESVMPYAITYTRVYIVFSIFNVFNVTMNNIVSSEGTAIATAISQIVSTLVYLCYILRKKSMFNFSIKECCFAKGILSEILKTGISTLIFQLLTSLSIGMINSAAKEYRGSALAAMRPVTKIMSMGTLIVFGFLKGFQPIAGFSYGAKKFDRLREAIKTAILWSAIFCVIFGLAAAIFSSQIISLFTKGDTEMVRTGSIALRANGLSFFLFGFYTVYSFLFLVMGKAAEGRILGACRQGICFVSVILLLPSVWGLSGVLCPAGCGCHFSHCHSTYGGSSAQRIADSGNLCFHSTPGTLTKQGGANEHNASLLRIAA